MFVDSQRLHIAVQKSGRLADYSRGLLRDAGLKIQNGKNALTARVDNFPIDLMFVRDDDIPTFVADGVCEFGMVGLNVLEEFALDQPEARFEVLANLGFGRCALRIAAPERTDYRGPESLRGSRIATSYPRLVRRWCILRLPNPAPTGRAGRKKHSVCDRLRYTALRLARFDARRQPPFFR